MLQILKFARENSKSSSFAVVAEVVVFLKIAARTTTINLVFVVAINHI